MNTLMKNTEYSLKKTARMAGLLYVIMCIPTPFALIYIPSHILVDGNPAVTTNNILAHEFYFRLSIVAQFSSLIVFVLLALTLYRLFNLVSDHLARLLVVFVVVQVPMAFLFETFNFTALMIAKGEIWQTVQTEQKQDLIMLLLNMHSYGIMTLEIFWGLWLIPFGQLVYKSGFIPRIFAFCLFIGGIGWVSNSVSFLLFPDYHHFISQRIMVIGAIGEFPIILWLLIMGVKNNISTIDKK
jgi:Domain of unknown function (DUF4386)